MGRVEDGKCLFCLWAAAEARGAMVGLRKLRLEGPWGLVVIKVPLHADDRVSVETSRHSTPRPNMLTTAGM